MSGLDLPQTRLSRIADPIIRVSGKAASWTWMLLLLVIVCNVALRYLWGEGRIEFEELQWHLYSIGFLVGLSYAVESDSHIRIDVASEHMRPRLRAWMELYGIALLLLPFIMLVLWYSLPFVTASFQVSEVSASPGGLPLRWLIKAMLPLGFALLLLATLSRFTRVWAYLFKHVSGAASR